MADDAEPNGGEVSDTAVSENENEYDDLEDSHMKDDDDKMTDRHMSPEMTSEGAAEVKKKYDAKDPLRPRRRKARRACYACQRAHLTCGDERPCQRCIKRGLADACQDGVRKKAKYLHDAPPEALGPVLGPNFNTHSHAGRSNGHRQASSVASEASTNVTAFFSQPSAASSYAVFSPQTQVTSLPESLPFGPSQQSPVSPTFQGPGGHGHGHGHSNPPMGGLGVPQVSSDIANFSTPLFDPSNPAIFNFNLEGLNFGSQYGALEFSMLNHMSSGAAETPPRDPSISQPGAGELTFGSSLFSSSGGVNFDKLYDGSSAMSELLGLEQSANGLYSQGNLQHSLPHAYAIAAGPSSLQSPSTENNSPQPTAVGFDGSPTTGSYGPGNPTVTTPEGRAAATTPKATTAAAAAAAAAASVGGPPPAARPKPKSSSTAAASLGRLGPQSVLGKRQQRDASHIYETVKDPYMYVAGFHRLIALLQRRFSASKVLRIAKSLSSIRPSLIACMRTLSRSDLVFGEKCFQRMLIEFDEFMYQASSPTVLCRRTGEVVAVNKEFTALTGWRKEVILGKEPNLNVNTGNAAAASNSSSSNTTGSNSSNNNNSSSKSNSANTNNNSSSSSNTTNNSSSSDPAAATASTSSTNTTASTNNTSSGRIGLSTPRLRSLNADLAAAAASGPQPVYIAELLDDDSVVQFYEDFAHMAFEDSRGSVVRKAKLLKYRTATQQQQQQTRPDSASSATGAASDASVKAEGSHTSSSPQQTRDPRKSILSSRVARIDGEHGISKIERDGKLECSYTWHIRRDIFDMPMMIVINFLPCYYPNQEPHQLAV